VSPVSGTKRSVSCVGGEHKIPYVQFEELSVLFPVRRGAG
jgi:hypothetical protein